MNLKDWVQIGLTLIGMVVGPLIAIRLSLRQFRSQKWWEQQTQKYSDTLEALVIVKHHFESHVAGKEGHALLNAAIPDATASLQRITATGRYYLSDKAAAALETFYKEWASAKVEEDETGEWLVECVTKCYDTVEQEARKARLT